MYVLNLCKTVLFIALTTGIIYGQTFNGRIGVSSDGNQHDPDDYGSSAWSVAMIACAGAEYVHHDYANHLGDNNAGMEAEMVESVIGAAQRFIGSTDMTFNCQDDLENAIASIAAQINASSADDRFYYCLGGPMEVPYQGVMAADPDKRQYCTAISHSGWNDHHTDTDQLNAVWEDLGDAGVELVHITDQNINLQENDLDYWWSWSRDHDDPNIRWLDDRRVGGDISDAGMVYYVVTGLGNQEGSPHDIRDLLAQGYSPTIVLEGAQREYSRSGSNSIFSVVGGRCVLPGELTDGAQQFCVYDAHGRELIRSVVRHTVIDISQWGLSDGNAYFVRLLNR